MEEHDAFLRAICADPDDDAGRLVFADWLQESDDPVFEARADLIRTQLAEAALPDDCAKRRRLRNHARDILKEYGPLWVGPLCGCTASAGPARPKWEFRRGFVESISVEAAAFPRYAEELFPHLPVRDVELRNVQGDRRVIDAIANSPRLRQVRALRFAPAAFNQPGLGDAGLERLLRSPHIGGLVELGLERQRLSNAAAELVADCPSLANLRALRLGLNRPNHSFDQGMDGEVVAALAAGRHLRLARLDLTHIEIGPEGVEALCGSPAFAGLTDLTLQRCGLGGQGVQALAGSNNLKELLRLDLRNNRLGVRAASALAHSRHLTKLAVLDLSGNRVTDAGVDQIARSRNARSLRLLTARRNMLGNAAAESLAKSLHFAELLTLDLRQNQISLAGGKAIALSENFAKLEHLDLRGNTIKAAQKSELRRLLGRKFGRL